MPPHPAQHPVVEGWFALVLGAGRGRRMGGPKPLMDAGGRPWWRVQESRLDAAGIPRLWVLSDDAGAAMLDAGFIPERATIADPDAPMFESLAAGIAGLVPDEPRGVFVLPADVPAPGPAVWPALALAAADAVARPVYKGKHGHPAALSGTWIEQVLGPAMEDGKEHRLDELIAGVVRDVEVDDPTVSVNLNSPRDLSRWLAAQARDSA